jgi:hypothetical protein
MAKRNTGKRIKIRDRIISNPEEDIKYVTNRDIREKTKLFKLERATGKEYCEVFEELGSLNMSPEEIAILTKIPKNRIKTWFKKGEDDLDNNIDSQERDMYVSYIYGLKSLEGSTVLSMMQKNPDKLLAKLNPDKYSDDVIDKYEIPTINIITSEKPSIEVGSKVVDKEDKITHKSEKKGEDKDE